MILIFIVQLLISIGLSIILLIFAEFLIEGERKPWIKFFGVIGSIFIYLFALGFVQSKQRPPVWRDVDLQTFFPSSSSFSSSSSKNTKENRQIPGFSSCIEYDTWSDDPNENIAYCCKQVGGTLRDGIMMKTCEK